MAISRERLEELIEQGATVWHDDYGEIRLDKKNHEILKVRNGSGEHIGWCLYFDYEYDNDVHTTEVDIEELEEDVESAKWHYEMDCQRVEKLILPTWNEFNTPEYINDQYRIIGFSNDNLRYWLHIVNGHRIKIYSFGRNINVFDEELTEENYIKACRLAKKLFLGESLENNEEK